MDAKFVIEKDTEKYMYIVDTGTEERSVTNDVEAVLEYLSENFELWNRRLFYKDSSGNVDEIVHYYGKFLQFAPGHAGIFDL